MRGYSMRTRAYLLLTPVSHVFLAPDLLLLLLLLLPCQAMLLDVEADCYWCLCKLVEGIQDHYTYAQPGIQRAVFKIQGLVA